MEFPEESKIEKFSTASIAAFKGLYQTLDLFKSSDALPGFLGKIQVLSEAAAKGIKDLNTDLQNFGKGLADDTHFGDGPKSDAQKCGDNVRHDVEGESHGPLSGVKELFDHLANDAHVGGGPVTGIENLLYHLSFGNVGVDPDETRRIKAIRQKEEDDQADKKDHSQTFDLLSPSLRDLNDRIHATADSFNDLQGNRRGTATATAYEPTHQRPGQPSPAINQPIYLTVAFDARKSTNQLANKLMPAIRQGQKQIQQMMPLSKHLKGFARFEAK